MKPRIEDSAFGSITIEGTVFAHDVIIRLSGRVKKRKKKLSKAVFGTSHVVSVDEAKHTYDEGAKRLIVGSGQHAALKLSDEASDFFEQEDCRVNVLPTQEAIRAWNESGEDTIGLFHVTC